jgi:hypothetical protein
MLATIRSVPSQRWHVSISMPNTRFNRRAQFTDTWGGVGGLPGSMDDGFAPLPRRAGVTRARSRLWGANTPWDGRMRRIVLGLPGAGRLQRRAVARGRVSGTGTRTRTSLSACCRENSCW